LVDKHDKIKDFYDNSYNEDERMVRQPLNLLDAKKLYLATYLRM